MSCANPSAARCMKLDGIFRFVRHCAFLKKIISLYNFVLGNEMLAQKQKVNLFLIIFLSPLLSSFLRFLAQSMALSKLCTGIGGKGGRKVFCLLMEPICFKFKCRGEGNQSACWGKPILFTTRIFVFCLGSSLHTIGIKSVSFIVKNKTAAVLRGTVCGGKAEEQSLQKCSRKILFFFGFL